MGSPTAVTAVAADKTGEGVKMTQTAYDQVGAIIAYEQGELDDEGTIELFQHLVNTGLAWKLQGHYGRTATALIEAGVVVMWSTLR